MIGQNNTWPVTVPAALKAGKYVFRHEIIALHGAGSANGAQNYPQCLNIEVSGDGTETPEGVVGTSLYTVDEVIFNPYAATINYTIPGPALWTGGSSSGTPTTPTTPTTSAKASSAPTATASSAPSSAPAVSASPVATPVEEPTATASASTVASATPSSGAGGSDELPTEFTIETFISWLEGKAAGSSSKARRHARSFF